MFNIEEMIGRIRDLSNQKTQNQSQAFNTDQTIKNHMQTYWEDLYMAMTEANENWFIKDEPVRKRLSSTDNSIVIDDLYKVIQVEKEYGVNNRILIPEGNLRERNDYCPINDENGRRSPWNYWANRNVFYVAEGKNKLVFYPEESVSGMFLVSYVPDPPDISSAEIKVPVTFGEWIVYSTALTIAIPEEADVRDLEKQRDKWQDRIERYMSKRTINSTQTVVDTGNFRDTYGGGVYGEFL